MTKVKTQPVSAATTTSKSSTNPQTVTAPKVEAATTEQPQKEVPNVETQSNILTVPVSIPFVGGATTKALFAIDLQNLGKSIRSMLEQFNSTFVVRVFSVDVEIKKSNDFTVRTFRTWKGLANAIFKNMEATEVVKDANKVAFLKAMPFKFSENCQAAVLRSIKVKEDLAKKTKIVINVETDALNVGTIELTKLLTKRIEQGKSNYQLQAEQLKEKALSNG